MPKRKQSEVDIFYSQVKSNMKIIAAAKSGDNSISSISKKMNIPLSTLSSKMAVPSRININDIYCFAKAYRVPYSLVLSDDIKLSG